MLYNQKEMSAAKHFISIIIPVYNGSRTITHCLESVFRSSYPSFECIVVDDHSTDNTLALAESFSTKIIRLDRQQGAAHARNRGAEAAQGNILLFIDADVKIYQGCLDRVAKTFEENPEITALFGSYDDQPGSLSFFSQYKNLFHHYIHQTSQEDASTFWTACGAIKKEVFFEIGKFNENCRMMEDIELGYRLKAKNHKIHLDKRLVVKHLKHYSFFSLLTSDLFDRAIPWTILILSEKQSTNDLNLKGEHKLSAVIILLVLVSISITTQSMWFLIAVPFLLGIFFFMNRKFYTFFLKKKGIIFTLEVVPLHFLYYLYSTLGFFIGSCKYLYIKHFSKYGIPSLKKI